MLSSIGAFAAVWLFCWALLGLICALLYLPLRPWLMRLHPQCGSALLLAYMAAPFALSLLVTVFLFLPDTKALLVDAHCHNACQSHTPVVGSSWIVVAGIVCLLAVLLGLAWRAGRTLLRSRRLYRQFAVLAARGRDYWLVNSSRPLVFALGWWRPRIYLSDSLLAQLDARELDIILSHEHAHRRRRDNLRLLASHLFSAGLPDRLLSRMRADIEELTERACDFHAADRYGYVDVAEVLLKVQRLQMRRGNMSAAPVAMAFAEHQVEARVRALLQADSFIQLRRWQMLLIGAAVMLAMLLLVEPLHHLAEWLFSLSNH